ncbi:Beta-N-acetylglucosaminidase [Clostridium amylolyticum]|uniref:Beta-N-acetylglucosaminidase n=1 Tax=Clostridium amylolyticum TaxID=1121298 RepID=A0A1M6M7F5_9CLOT|nr:glucosaminidase domain-containing protein [Clostridium amylolyticum]SHJ79409.1 Beta-N-acetylglucosaminidase [Clostridium amylolyticum]
MKNYKKIFIVMFLLMIVLPFKKAYAGINDMNVQYRGHVQDVGWQNYVNGGEVIGSTGFSRRLESFNLQLTNFPPGAKIKYQAHVAEIGWQNWMENGQLAGTTGKSLRMEAIKIVVEGMPSGYHVEYQAHVQEIGWQNWVRDGQLAGTTGRSLRMEALRVRLVKDNSLQLESEGHFQDLGWIMPTYNGNSLSFDNKSLRMEGIKLKINNAPAGMSIQYQGHSQDIGWQNWVQNGELAGTVGMSSKLEAFRVRLLNAPAGWHVRYKSYVEGIGWEKQWSEDGIQSGTTGQNKKVFAVIVELYYDNTPGKNNLVYSLKPWNYTLDRFAFRQFEGDRNKYQGTAASIQTIRDFTEPNNQISSSRILQHLKINKFREPISVTELNAFFDNITVKPGNKNVFKGQGQAFIDAAKAANIDTLYLIAHAMWETGYGNSTLAQGIYVDKVQGNPVPPATVYNFFGINAFDSNANLYGAEAAYNLGWTSPEAAIREGAKWISNNYIHCATSTKKQYTVYYMKWNNSGFVDSSQNTLWHQYATDVNWANGIASLMDRLLYIYKGVPLEVEIPQYN